RALLEACPGTIFMQPVAETPDGLRAAASAWIELAPERVVPKLPMTPAGMQAALALKRDGARVAFTAVYSVAQAYSGQLAGADWVIPYFGRLRRAGVDACQRIGQIARLLARQSEPMGQAGQTTRLLVASVKSPADVVEVVMTGAHDITAQPDVIRALLEETLTHAAIAQFAADARSLHELHQPHGNLEPQPSPPQA
ncbi:MAG: transaldolase family protein, partial [Ktedonobacterales bacterium]